jgi:hypothetical protein
MAADLRTRLWRTLSRLDDADVGSSVFSDDDAAPALWVDGVQIAHFRAADVVEVRLTKAGIRADRARLAADPRVELRKNPSDWLRVRFAQPADIAFVRELVSAAIEAHAPTGRAARPPPSGAELARRKRFH